MSEPEQPDHPPKPDDSPSKGDIAALGIGCLVTLILLGAAVFLGMSRG